MRGEGQLVFNSWELAISEVAIRRGRARHSRRDARKLLRRRSGGVPLIFRTRDMDENGRLAAANLQLDDFVETLAVDPVAGCLYAGI